MLLERSLSPSISTGSLGTGIPADRDRDFDLAATTGGACGVSAGVLDRDAGGGSGGCTLVSSPGVLLRAPLLEAAFAGTLIAGLSEWLLARAFAAGAGGA